MTTSGADYSTYTKNDLIRAMVYKESEYARIRQEWIGAFEMANKGIREEIDIIKAYLQIHM